MIKSLFRLWQILIIIRRYRIDQYLYQVKGVKPLKYLKYGLFWVKAQEQHLSVASRMRLALEALGPIWIKLGQLLSIQDDFFSADITEELKLLQDQVSPFPDDQAMAMLASELGVAPQEVFDRIDTQPLATASIAQVYTASLNLVKFQQLRQLQAEQKTSINLELHDLADFKLGKQQHDQAVMASYTAYGAQAPVVPAWTPVVTTTADSDVTSSDAEQQLDTNTTTTSSSNTPTNATSTVTATTTTQATTTIASKAIEETVSNSSTGVTATIETRETPAINDIDTTSTTTASPDTHVEVVIKLLRPHVAKTVFRELKLIRSLFGMLASYYDKANRLRGSEIVDELERTFKVELNLTTEAGNGQTLRGNWLDSPLLYIPKIFISSPSMLVSERLYLTPFNQVEFMEQRGADLELLARRGVEIFFSQLLTYNFFHADMHPGNIFVDVADPTNPTYAAVDFGIVGSLNAVDTKYLVGNLIAFFQQDYRKIAQLHVDSGWIRGKVDINEFERRLKASLDPLFNKSLDQIRFSQVLKNLFSVAREFNMVVQPQLLLLEKTLVYVEAMGRALYPELNLWETAKPILEQWFADEYSISNQSKKLVKNLPEFMNLMSHMPHDMYRVFDNHLFISNKLTEIDHKLTKLTKKVLVTMFGMFGVVLLILSMFSVALGLSLVITALIVGLAILVLLTALGLLILG